MNRVHCSLVVLGLISICLSVLSCYWVWESREESDSGSLSYLVQSNSVKYYRLYVMVNRNTVIADEDVGLKLYPISVSEGDKIEIHGYSEEPFTVALETEGLPLASENDRVISISYTVP